VLRSILEIRAQALHDQGYLDLQEAFIDGSFSRQRSKEALAWARRHTGGPGHSGRNTVARCVATNGGGRSSDFAWFQNFQRIVVRYERFAENFLGMLRLAAASFFCGGCEMASSLGGPPNRGFPAWASPA
jgi:hypothetical protein